MSREEKDRLQYHLDLFKVGNDDQQKILLNANIMKAILSFSTRQGDKRIFEERKNKPETSRQKHQRIIEQLKAQNNNLRDLNRALKYDLKQLQAVKIIKQPPIEIKKTFDELPAGHVKRGIHFD